MKIVCNTFWLPKKGCSIEEYEDAFAPDGEVRDKTNLFRCSVADGATETSFSRQWAQILTKAYVSDELVLPQLQAQWWNETKREDLPWYAEEKRQSGAFAALVGLTLIQSSRTGRGTWQAIAVGDSCIFQVRDGILIESFPLNSWRQFGSTPALLSSNQRNNSAELLAKLDETISGSWKFGDKFLLMTDAISAWFLRRQEENNDAVETFLTMEDAEKFSALVSTARESRDGNGRTMMRNDDVTVMCLDVG